MFYIIMKIINQIFYCLIEQKYQDFNLFSMSNTIKFLMIQNIHNFPHFKIAADYTTVAYILIK